MTTPAPPQQPYAPSQQPPSPPLKAAAEAELVATTAGLLVTALGAGAVVAALAARFRIQGDLRAGLYGSATIATEHPPPVTGVIGHASAQTSRQNLLRRAQFVVSAGKRLAGDIRQARAQGKPVGAALLDGLARERRYYGLHQKAMWDRATAAGQIDMEAATHGRLLGWYAKDDKRTTAACLKADGCNFYVDDPPDIGLPGIGPHVGCRCKAGAPHPGGRLLPSRGRTFARAA